MRNINIQTKSKSYQVLIGRDLLENIGHEILTNLPSSKGTNICIVTDTNIDSLYADQVETSLAQAGYRISKYVVEPGEANKDLINYQAIIDHMSKEEMTRQDMVLALGGGLVGDLAGFCAATYQRGLGLVQVPTSLLAMIDSSVGGKTAINTSYGKNQIGAFYQPDLVVCDINSLDSLKDQDWSSGMGEMVKYAVLDKSLDINKLASRSDLGALMENIYQAISIKAKYVMADEFDKGQRQALNLGHTLGHAIEKLSDYELRHGQAVALGLNLISRYAVARGMMKFSDHISIAMALDKAGLDLACPYEMDQLMDLIRADKKRQGDKINLIVPRSIGDCQIIEIDLDDLASFDTRPVATRTMKSGLLGESLSHSKSPELHLGLGDYDYQLYEIARDEIDNYMKDYPLDCSNVTIPYKETALGYCDDLSARANSIGAVNTLVKLGDGSLYGDNTDYYGFSKMVQGLDLDPSGKYVLILGSGGASKTVEAYMKDMGAGQIVIVSRSGQDNYENLDRHYDLADIIVNTTPLGMYPNIDQAPLDLGPFKRLEAVLDLIYNPEETRLLSQAKSMGIRSINGMTMLEEQAKLASFIFKQSIL
jgi:3-dehydroquinate synthase